MTYRKKSQGNTEQHSFRMDPRLWITYKEHRESIGSNASEGLRSHAIGELVRAGKLTPDLLEPVEA